MDRTKNLPIDLIVPDPSQPRKRFDDDGIESLARSLKAVGQVMPVLVRQGDDKFVLIDGERRWLAAQRAGLTDLKAVLRAEDPGAPIALQQLASENREKLTTMERARAYADVLAEGMDRTQLADAVGVSATTLSDYLRLTDLADNVQSLVDDGIPLKGAVELLALPTEAAHALATAALTHGWSAERIRMEVGKSKAPPREPSLAAKRTSNKVQLTLRQHLKLPVVVRPATRGDGATITITARRQADVERVSALLMQAMASTSHEAGEA